MKLQPTCCCSWNYYALMLLYICMVIYSLEWPDPISRRDTITCSISAYTANDNAPMRTRVWPCETRSLLPSALPHGHFNPINSVLLSKSFNISVQQFITWVPIVHLLTMHHVSSLFIQLGRSQSTTHWTWLLNGTESLPEIHAYIPRIIVYNWCRNNHTFGIQPLEIQTHSFNAFSAIFRGNNDLLCLHPSQRQTVSKYLVNGDCISWRQFTVLSW